MGHERVSRLPFFTCPCDTLSGVSMYIAWSVWTVDQQSCCQHVQVYPMYHCDYDGCNCVADVDRTFQVSPEKSTVYEWNPHTIQELKDNISHSAAAIKITMLHRVYLNMIRRAQLCIDARGNNLQHLLWRYILSAFGYCINVLYLRCATDLSYFFVAHPVL